MCYSDKIISINSNIRNGEVYKLVLVAKKCESAPFPECVNVRILFLLCTPPIKGNSVLKTFFADDKLFSACDSLGV